MARMDTDKDFPHPFHPRNPRFNSEFAAKKSDKLKDYSTDEAAR
jgi:hypothetical protein